MATHVFADRDQLTIWGEQPGGMEPTGLVECALSGAEEIRQGEDDGARDDRALTEGWIGGAALDVLETEPPPPDLPLLRHEHLLVTAHQAFYSEEALRELQRKAAQNLLDALEATS